MKAKQIIAVILAVIMIYLVAPGAYASEITSSGIDVIIHDEEKNARIDELFALRSQLELDFEANAEQINQIDQQLALLGVETITYDEVLSALGVDAVPNYDVASTANTQWTSRRLVTTCNGQHYELQIVEGLPLNSNSPLFYNPDVIKHEATGFVAAAFDVIKVIAAAAVGGIPDIGAALSSGVTFADIVQAIRSNFSTTTVIENVKGEAEVKITTHVRYILAKRYEEPDINNQATCYIGTSVAYKVTTEVDADWFENGELQEEDDIKTIVDDTSVSDYYDDYSLAVRKYHDYRNYNIDYSCDYRVTYVKMRIFEEDYVFTAPFEYPSFVF